MGLEDDRAWAAMLARDSSYDGRFVTGVLSTGIYCRPSCAARHPKRENVRFFADAASARLAGLRPCLRCRPDDLARDEAAVQRVLEYCQQADNQPRLDDLGRLTGYAPTHMQRIFTRALGLSPAAYWRALRRERLVAQLSQAQSVTAAAYDAGYGAASRFYADAEKRLGMAPSIWKEGGMGVTIHWTVVETSLGPLLIAATEKGACRVAFDEDEAALRARFPKAVLDKGGKDFADLVSQVVKAVEAPGADIRIPLDVRGTAFQEAVWRALLCIPAGETMSYAQLATAVGRPKAVRAVGSACGANALAVLIPCHRAMRSDGKAGGYAWGLQRKKTLLRQEAQARARTADS